MNYKSIKSFDNGKVSGHTGPEDYILEEIEILEDLLDFESEIFKNLVKTFSICYDSGDFIKCHLILIKEMIPFFQSNREILEENKPDISFFIRTFEENHIFEQFSHVIQEKNEVLINSTILFLSLISSLDENICQSIANCPGLIESLICHILEYEDELFENSVVLLNNSLQFFKNDIPTEFIKEFIEKIQKSNLNTKFILNILTNLIRIFDIPISDFPFFLFIINKGMLESLFLDSLNLIYYCYRNETNKNFLFTNYLIGSEITQKIDNFIDLKQFISMTFSNNDCIILYFRILLDILAFICDNFDEENQNKFNSLIFENLKIETIKNALMSNDSHIIQYVFLFLSKSPHRIIEEFAQKCFEDENSCIRFIISCILDRELWLKKIALSFLSIFLKEMGSIIFMKEANEIKEISEENESKKSTETNESKKSTETNENKKSIEMKSIETNESKKSIETNESEKSIKTKIIKKQTDFFLNFLIDFNFLNTLIEFIESNEPETQKISLRFLNSMISMNFFCQSYSEQLFAFFKENEFIEIIDELKVTSEDDEVIGLAENIMNYFIYTIDENKEEEETEN